MPSAPIDDRRARAIPHETSALILEEDPDLARGLPPVDRELLSELFQARVVPIAGRRWVPPAIDSANAFGLLLLDGVIGRRTRVAEAVATELLSTGDILRPWEQAGTSYPIEPEIDWRVLRPGRAAILDEGITRLIGGRPELLVAFSERLVRRAHNAGYLMALNHFSRVEDRLLATLWHLAATWGRVTPQGISIPFRLTHETLGEITGARRSTVTIAVGLLQDRGQLARGIDGRYVMTGDPENWRLPG